MCNCCLQPITKADILDNDNVISLGTSLYTGIEEDYADLEKILTPEAIETLKTAVDFINSAENLLINKNKLKFY